MDSADLFAFARRDWELLARSKVRYWAQFKRKSGFAAILRIGDGLRQHVRVLHPDWPTEQDRHDDLETHSRVAMALRRAGTIRAR